MRTFVRSPTPTFLAVVVTSREDAAARRYEALAWRLKYLRAMTANLPAVAPVAWSRALWIGRERELAQLVTALRLVGVAVIYGVPGVGKTSLAQAYARAWDGPVASVALHADTTPAMLSAEVHRQLGVTRYELGAPIAELWQLLARARGLLIVDDLHAWPPALRAELVRGAAGAGRLIATSRELVAQAVRDPDRLQLRLDGLAREPARALWDALVERYGIGGDFERAWQRSRGNPFLLRRAHVGAGDRPVVGGLEEPLRAAAWVIAVSDAPLSAAVLAQIAPAPVIDALITRLVIEPDARGDYVMHALWRDALRAPDLEPCGHAAAGGAGDAGGRLAASRRALVKALLAVEDGALALRIQEVARQLRALGGEAELAALLHAHGRALVREGADGWLLHELETLPAHLRGPELAYLRARTLCYGLQMRRGFAGLAGERGDPATRLCLANLATWSGELGFASRALDALIGDAAVPVAIRTRAQVGRRWVAATRGDAAAAHDPATALYCAVIGDERARAADLAHETVARLATRPQRLWSRLITPVLCGLAFARVGRFADADAIVAWLEDAVELPAERAENEWTRAIIAGERGARIAAIATLQRVLEVISRGGFFAGIVWTQLALARLHVALGRRTAGLAWLAAARATAAQHASSAFAAAIAAVGDPLAAPSDATTPAERLRVDLFAALERACTGSPPGTVDIPASADFGFDRALLALADAVAARRLGRSRRVAHHLRRAHDEAARAGADDDIIALLYERSTAAPTTLTIDATRHELCIGAIRYSLATRRALRALLYAFAAAPGHTLSRDAIAHALWRTTYDPLRHDSSLKSSIRRLRALLGASSATIEAVDAGYRFIPAAPLELIAKE